METVSQRFSYVVAEYFGRRDTYPLTLSYPAPVDEDRLDKLQEEVFQTFHNLDGVDVLCTEQLQGEFWEGVLIELSGSEHTDEPYDNGPIDMPALDHSVHPIAMDIHREFAPESLSPINVSTGFACGESAYSKSCLQALGREYFTRANDPNIQ